VTEEELRRAKDHLKGSLMLSLESTSSRMNRLASTRCTTERSSRWTRCCPPSMAFVTRSAALITDLLDEDRLALTTLGPLDRRNLPASCCTTEPSAALGRARSTRRRLRMPLTYRIDSDAGMLLVVGEGTISQAERIEAISGWLRHPEFRQGLNTLCDFSAATSTPTKPSCGRSSRWSTGTRRGSARRRSP